MVSAINSTEKIANRDSREGEDRLSAGGCATDRSAECGLLSESENAIAADFAPMALLSPPRVMVGSPSPARAGFPPHANGARSAKQPACLYGGKCAFLADAG